MPLAASWSCAGRTLDLSRPRIMGVLNVTPDSFSDGGTHNTPDAAIAAASEMLSQGADLIDVGGESTRPGFVPVDPDDEFRRLEPAVRWLVRQGALVSIDTRHAEVARRCLDLGAQIINDVTGFSDPAMIEVAEGSSCGCILMHSGPVSGTATRDSAIHAEGGKDDLSKLMSTSSAGDRAWEKDAVHPLLPDAGQVLDLLEGYLLEQAHLLEAHGVSSERICLDPGVGFGKSPEDNIQILRNTSHTAELGYPLMCAVSRKRFVGTVSGVDDAALRDKATIGITLSAAAQGARVLRVHDVKGTAEALDGFWAASSSWTMLVDVSIDLKSADLSSVTAAIDSMPLTRLQSVQGAADPEGYVHAAATTALGMVPFRHALDAALAPLGAKAAAAEPQPARTGHNA